MKLIEEEMMIRDIPLLLCRKNDSVKRPVVILSHGFTGSKQSMRDGGYVRDLAEMGYCAVAIDNRLHGDRPGPDFLTAAMTPSGHVDLYILRRAIKETADDVKALIDALSGRSDVDTDRVAMTGVSMGGFITYRTMVIDYRITVGIPIISSPHWDDIPGDVPATTRDEAEWKHFSESYQPSGYPERFYPRPLLMQIGDMDGHYDKDKVTAFHHRLTGYYRDIPDDLKLIIYPDTAHTFTKEMWDQAQLWLREKL